MKKISVDFYDNCTTDYSALVQAEPIKLKVGVDMQPYIAPATGAAAWPKMVTERTEGRIETEFYHSDSLSDQKSIVEVIRPGLADAGMVAIASHCKSFPLHSLFEVIGSGFPDSVEACMRTPMLILTSLKGFLPFQRRYNLSYRNGQNFNNFARF